MRITVIGCGYLGATHAAAMAELGHEVLGIESDPVKRQQLTEGRVPIYEPGLSDLLSHHVASGRLRFTDSWAEVADFGDLHFLCVGTPQKAARWPGPESFPMNAPARSARASKSATVRGSP